jgi:hypothetical protein
VHPNVTFDTHYRAKCEAAYKRYYEQGRCAYQGPYGQCKNTKDAHERFHQRQDGAIIGEGEFESPFKETHLSRFLEQVKIHHRTKAAKLYDYHGQRDEYTRAVISEHRATLKSERSLWSTMFSNITCFFCLSNPPQQTLACGHSLCESCLRRFGTSNRKQGTITLSACDLCQRTSEHEVELWTFRLKPDAAGVRILSLDGGGVRGIISVTILQLLEEEIGLDIPIHQFFDLIVGTSTGM